jgi:rhodanese-related sulfurtransferase
MKFRALLFLLVSFVITSCNGQTSKNIKLVEVKEFAEKTNKTQNPQILDVRTPGEFTDSHIENALNIDWLGDSFVVDAEKLDKTKPVYVYCKSGGRSKKATAKLEELGFKNIYELDGGFMKWSAEELNKH